MAKFVYQSNFKSASGNAKVKLFLISFQDDNGIHFVYSPHLDISGYGETLAEAKESFNIAYEDFIDYTLKKQTLGKVLKKLGWTVKGKIKKPKKILAPKIESVIGKNQYVADIFNKYQTNTYHKEVGFPSFAQ